MFEEPPDVDSEIIFVGRSNVGKSTLMREITGKKVDIGRRPGVTLEPNHYDWASESFMITDMPGFGFMGGVREERIEEIKNNIVRYIERHSDRILLAVQVIDAKSFVDIVDRWRDRGEVPHDIDLYNFLTDVDIPVIIAANKMDKVDNRDERLNEISERFGLLPPWRQWDDIIAPISAKRGSIEPLLRNIRDELKNQKRHDLLKFFS
ncbi:MAG: GTP-binding protein EngB [Halobacteria archaeon]|nr:GTP-binding protein EngB [Halobacteria archaeon]